MTSAACRMQSRSLLNSIRFKSKGDEGRIRSTVPGMASRPLFFRFDMGDEAMAKRKRANGEGCVRYDKVKRCWVAEISYWAGGKQRKRRRSCKSQSEAIRKRDELKKQYATGAPQNGSALTILPAFGRASGYWWATGCDRLDRHSARNIVMGRPSPRTGGLHMAVCGCAIKPPASQFRNAGSTMSELRFDSLLKNPAGIDGATC